MIQNLKKKKGDTNAAGRTDGLRLAGVSGITLMTESEK